MLERIANYLKGVRGEVDRVSWPTRNEVISLTALILLLVVVLTIYIWGVDTILQAIIRFFVQL
ncbi:TPA: preprotein translocase subunit SecE [Candidatus Acetothermia bacterium]|nr:preprotein translocase subunit SecE [Candidatus Bipolaricaulota bacterium]HCP31810.1 preprotein translocase subunit SecE [Candidatus Acetothermia bacterium]